MLPLENGALHSLLLLMLKQAHKHQVCLLGDKKRGKKAPSQFEQFGFDLRWCKPCEQL